MKKNELVHLHALLARVAADYRERGLLEDADLEPYRDVGVGPRSLTASRADHRKAVRALLSILAAHSETGRAVEPEPERPTGNH